MCRDKGLFRQFINICRGVYARAKRTKKQYESEQLPENQMTQQKVKRAPKKPKTEELETAEPKAKAKQLKQLELTQQPKPKAKPKRTPK